MSQENVIRATYQAWCDNDLDAVLETCDPNVEFRTTGAFPDLEPIYLGHDGIHHFWDAMRAPWEWFQLHVDRVIEGEDCAAIVVRFRARGRESGVITDLHQGHAMRFKNGRITEVSAHGSFEGALTAVGLVG